MISQVVKQELPLSWCEKLNRRLERRAETVLHSVIDWGNVTHGGRSTTLRRHIRLSGGTADRGCVRQRRPIWRRRRTTCLQHPILLGRTRYRARPHLFQAKNPGGQQSEHL